MKKQNIRIEFLALLLIGICLMSSDNSLVNASGYETSSRTKLSLEQNSNNFEVASKLTELGTYPYFTQPTLNSESLSHDLTVVEISRLQSYSNIQLPTVFNSSCSNRITRIQNITEQTISAPFDTQFNIVSGYNTTSRFYAYPESYSVTTGSTSSGSVSALNSNGSSSLVLKAASNLPTGYLSANSYTKSYGDLNGRVNIDATYTKLDSLIMMWSVSYRETSETLKFDFTTSSTNYHRAYLKFQVYQLACDVELLDEFGNVLSTTNYAVGSYDTYIENVGNIHSIRFKTASGSASTEKRVDVDYLSLQTNLEYSLSTSINIGFNQVRIVNDLDYAVRYKIYADSEAALLSSSLTIDGVSCSTPYNTFSSAFFSVSQSNNLTISIILNATGIETNIYLDLDYVECNPIYDAIEYSTINQLSYAISGITYYSTLNLTHTSITANRYSGIVFVNSNYSFDSSALSEYDYVNDLILNAQNLNFTFTISSGIIVNFNATISFTQNTWTLPSAENLKVNGESVTDDTYNSGYVSLVEYPTTLTFTADSSNILFNFTIVNHFTYETDLTIISHTYYMKSFVCSPYHNVVLSRVDYLFDALIKHSYLNNVDYLTAKTINPNFNWVKGSTLKIEVILNDDAYLPLSPIDLTSNQTSLLSLFATTQSLSYTNQGTQSINIEIPEYWQVDERVIVSNIRYLEPYVSSGSNSYTVTQETQSEPVFSTEFNSNKRDPVSETSPYADSFSQGSDYIPECVETITNSTNNADYYNLQSMNQTISMNNVNSSESGIYNATACGTTFKNTADDGQPVGFSGRPSYNPSSWSVKSNFAGHNKVLNVVAGATPVVGTLYYSLPTTVSSLTVEYWACTTGTNAYGGYILLLGSGNAILGGVSFKQTSVYAIYSGTWNDCSASVSANTFQHIRIIWNSNADSYIYLNGTLIKTYTGITNGGMKIEIGGDANTNSYFDAISCVNEAGYYTNISTMQYMSINSTATTNFNCSLNSILNMTAYLTATQSCSVYLHNFQSNTNTLMGSSNLLLTVSDYARSYFNNTPALIFYIYKNQISAAFSVNYSIQIQIYYFASLRNETAPNLLLSYQSHINVGDTLNITVSAQHSIVALNSVILWNNLTNTNASLGTTDGQYSFLITRYNFTILSFYVYISDISGNWKKIAVENIVWKRLPTQILTHLASPLIVYAYQIFEYTIFAQNGSIIPISIYSYLYAAGMADLQFWIYGNTSVQIEDCTWIRVSYGYPGSNQYLGCNYTTSFVSIPCDIPYADISYQTKVQVGETIQISCHFQQTTYEILYAVLMSNQKMYILTNNAEFIASVENDETFLSLNGEFVSIPDINSFNFQFNLTHLESVADEVFVSVNDIHGFASGYYMFNLFWAKNQTDFAISGLYSHYLQNDSILVNTTSSLHPVLTLTNPNAVELLTDTDEIAYNLEYSVCGFYTITAEIESTNQYLGFRIDATFELLPVEHTVLASEISLQVNSQNIISALNFQNNSTLSFTCIFGGSYDLEIQMNLSRTISFNAIESFEFETTTTITEFEILNATISNYPSFARFYLDFQLCSNYSISSNTLILNSILNQTYLNHDTLSLAFEQNTNQFYQQLDSNVSTSDQSVHMREYYSANRTFNYYYFSEEYDTNSVTLEHMRTSAYMSLMHESSDYYFSRSILSGDLFLANWDLNPNFIVNYSVLSQTELNTSVSITVKSDFYIENISVSLFLPTYFPSWSAAASMTLDKKLKFDIPYSSNITQTFILTGWNSNFTHSYSIQSNSTYIRLEYSAIAHSNLTNVLDFISLNNYYGAWTCENLTIYQDYETKVLSFTIPAVNQTRVHYIFEGFGTNVEESFEILTSNGTFAQIEYLAYSYLPKINYAVTLELAVYDVFQENWSCSNESISSITQNEFSKRLSFNIPSFQGQINLLFTGISNVPTAIIDTNRMLMNQSLDISSDMNVTYVAFLNYTKYSTQWFVNLNQSWTLDGIHYQNDTYDILSSGYFECPGWGTSISTSYLKFITNPIENIVRIENGSFIYIIINCSLPLDSANYELRINSEASYKLVCNYSTISVTSELVYVMGIDLIPGENILVFEIQTVDMSRNFWFIFPILILVVGYIAYYVYQKYYKNRSQKDKVLPKNSTAADQKKVGGSK